MSQVLLHMYRARASFFLNNIVLERALEQMPYLARTPITCTRILDRVPLVHKKWHVELIEDFLSLHLVFKF